MGTAMQRTLGGARWLAYGALLAGVAVACSSNPTTAVQIEVRNDNDNFQFHATAVSQGSDLRSYTWQNSGTRATLDITIQGSAGSVHLEVRDGSNSVVYNTDLPANLVTTTATGVAGGWRVTVSMTNFTGTVALLVTKL